MKTSKNIKTSNSLPQRGELWIVDFEPGYGRGLRKKRPSLIISSNSIQKNTPYVIIIPTSSQVPSKVTDDTVLLPKQEGLLKNSVLLPLFIRSVDQDRLIKKIGTLSQEKLQETEEAIKLVLNIETES